jgi:hypothetical protein
LEYTQELVKYITELTPVLFVPTKRTNPSGRRTPAAVICPAIGLRLTVIKVIGMSSKPTFMACQADSGQSSVQLAEPNSRGGLEYWSNSVLGLKDDFDSYLNNNCVDRYIFASNFLLSQDNSPIHSQLVRVLISRAIVDDSEGNTYLNNILQSINTLLNGNQVDNKLSQLL